MGRSPLVEQLLYRTRLVPVRADLRERATGPELCRTGPPGLVGQLVSRSGKEKKYLFLSHLVFPSNASCCADTGLCKEHRIPSI